ncbi:MAG: O-antigen ligase family protein, partial [Planctomycetota bacterium]
GIVGTHNENRQPWAAFVPAGLILALAGYGWLQTIEGSIAIISMLSPASAAAYRDWAGLLLASDGPMACSISIAPFDSLHVISVLAVLSGLAVAAPIVFWDRSRCRCLLIAMAVFGTSVALIGLGRLLNSDWMLWSFQEGGEGAPFGTFPNRNNAAFGMNLGIAGALATAVWHFGAHGYPLSMAKASWSLLKDPWILIPAISMTLIAVAILSCGSRGGAISMVVAAGVTGAVVARPSVRSVAWFSAVIVLAASVYLVTQTQPRIGEAARVDAKSAAMDALERAQGDARLLNWPDGFRAGVRHLPMGSGLASYGYAYLPWQETSPWRWCVHADNLWLEAFVELGLPGCLMIGLAAAASIISLRRLASSSDPLDRAFALAGTYVMATIAVSQCFDFGLIIPANLFSTTVFFSVMVARGAVIERERPSRTKLVLQNAATAWWASPIFLRFRLPGIASILVTLIVSVPAIRFLKNDSLADTYARSIPVWLKRFRGNDRMLTERADAVRSLATRHPQPDFIAA